MQFLDLKAFPCRVRTRHGEGTCLGRRPSGSYLVAHDTWEGGHNANSARGEAIYISSSIRERNCYFFDRAESVELIEGSSALLISDLLGLAAQFVRSL